MRYLGLNFQNLVNSGLAVLLMAASPAGAGPLEKIIGRDFDRLNPLQGAAADLLRSVGTDDRVNLRSTSSDASFGLSSDHAAERFTFENGISVCDQEIKAIPVLQQLPVLLGTVPRLDYRSIAAPVDWPLAEDGFAAAQMAQYDFNITQPLTLVSSEKCYLNHDDTLIPVWDLIIEASGSSYHALANADEVFLFESRSFDVDGKSQIFSHKTYQRLA